MGMRFTPPMRLSVSMKMTCTVSPPSGTAVVNVWYRDGKFHRPLVREEPLKEISAVERAQEEGKSEPVRPSRRRAARLGGLVPKQRWPVPGAAVAGRAHQ
jgi:hypothetical protein